MKKIKVKAVIIIFFGAMSLLAAAVNLIPSVVNSAAIVIKRNTLFGYNIQGLINQKWQTMDDWLNSGGIAGEYTGEEGTWAAVTGSPFSGYDTINYEGNTDLYSGAVKQDKRTGLWWSDIMAIATTASSTHNVFTLSADGSRPSGGAAIGFCDALNTANFGGHNDWYLPTQKQLMQAYINGLANNLANPGYSFWSSTEYTSNSASAWYVALSNGYTGSNTKVTLNRVRCVRP